MPIQMVFLVGAIAITSPAVLFAAEPKVDRYELERRLYDVLRVVHNQGADLYDTGDRAGCYRIFQGGLTTARAMLAHRPDDQKWLDEAVAAAEKLPSPAMKAFALHEVIEKLRDRIKPAPVREPELLTVPPVEQKQATAKEKLPIPFLPPLGGMGGTVYWQGQPVAGVELMFVSRGRPDIQIYETKTDAQGQYVIDKMRPGLYTVVLELTQNRKSVLPERYRTTQTSPLIVEERGKGEIINMLLK